MKLLLILTLIIPVFKLFATGQVGDRIIIDNETFQLLATPLEKVLAERNISPAKLWENDEGFNTGCWRGYIATWKLEGSKLYLEEIIPCNYNDYPKGKCPKADLKKMFPDLFDNGHIFANWVNEELLVAKGEMLWYEHSGFNRVHAKETGLFIKRGNLEKTIEYDNSKTKTSPYAHDGQLLGKFINSNIRWKEIRPQIDHGHMVICEIFSADDNGKIDSVRILKGASEVLNQEAVRVLKSIPQWDVIYKKGKRMFSRYTLPIRFDIATMEKYKN